MPPRGWQWLNLRELWLFRELVFFLAWRDVKVRYKQTILGAAWAVLQPAMMMVVFTILFHKIGGVGADGSDYPYPEKVPYYLIAFLGLLPWTFFANAITTAGQSVLGSERLITKIYFPRLALPFAAVAAALVDSLIASALLVVMMAWHQVPPTWNLLLLPVIYALIIVAALGVGALLAGLASRLPRFPLCDAVLDPTMDVRHDRGLQRAEEVRLRRLARHGAGAESADGVGRGVSRRVPGRADRLAGAGVLAVCVVVLFVAGCFYFRKVEDWFADII